MTFRPMRPLSPQDISSRMRTPEPTLGNVWNAAMDLGFVDRETNVLARSSAIDDLNATYDLVPPEKLNEVFPGMDKPFKAPESMNSALFKWEETQERRKNEQILSRAKGWFKGGIVPFVGQSVSAMMDPIGFGLGVFLGWGAGKVAVKGGILAAKNSRTFGREFLENVVGNSMSETIVYRGSQKELRDYTATQALTNVIAGSVVGAGITYGVGKGMEKFKGMGTKTSDAAFRTSEEAIAQGKNLTGIIDPLSDDIGNDLKVNNTFIDSVTDALPEEQASKVLKEESLDKAFMKLRQLSEEGEIEPNKLREVVEAYEEAGGDTRHKTLMDEDELTELNKESSRNLDRNLQDERNNYGYDEEARKVLAERARIKESVNDEFVLEADEGFQRVKEAQELGTVSEAEVNELATLRSGREYFTEVVRCMGFNI